MRSALVCDFGGVMTTPLLRGFLAYQERDGVSPEQVGQAMRAAAERHGEYPLFALERGEISEREFGRRLAEHLPDGFDFARLREVFFERLEPNRAMVDFVAGQRRRGVRTAICTNNVREWEPLWRAKLPELDEIFEVVVDSALVGSRKPERRIYELTLERLGVPAGQCVFVDDLELNCAAARELGMAAVRFESAEQAIPAIEAALR
jgi:putative hydrolase of the HAD superfamily